MVDILGNPFASGSLTVTETYSIPLLIDPYHNLLPGQSVPWDSFCNGYELRGGRPNPTWTVSRIQASQLELKVLNQTLSTQRNWHCYRGTDIVVLATWYD
jgi:hypothetical protein